MKKQSEKKEFSLEFDYYHQGKALGLEYAKTAPPDLLRVAHDWKWQPGEEPARFKGEEMEPITDHLRKIIEEDDLMDVDNFGVPNEYTNQFVAGWKSSIDQQLSMQHGHRGDHLRVSAHPGGAC